MTKLKGKRLRLSAEEVELINESRGVDVENINGNTALELHLKERGINKEDVVSVKHWQNMGGELRFSIVTKQEYGLDEEQILDKINNKVRSSTKSNHWRSTKDTLDWFKGLKNKNLLKFFQL